MLGDSTSKTFKNHIGFERGFWRRKTGQAASVPKKEGFGEGRSQENMGQLDYFG
jgi:hypothetical protein